MDIMMMPYYDMQQVLEKKKELEEERYKSMKERMRERGAKSKRKPKR